MSDDEDPRRSSAAPRALRNAGARTEPEGSLGPTSGAAIAEERTRRVAAAAARWSLTPGEHEVLAGVVKGLTNKEIACERDCAEGTVEAHVSHILKKSGAASRTALVDRVWSGE